MLIKRFISFVAAAVLAVTTLPMATLAQAESPNNFVLIEGNETQHILTYIEGLTAILEVDGLKFKDHNKNGSLDVVFKVQGSEQERPAGCV